MELKALPGVGDVRVEQLGRLGIVCAEDLLRFYPRAYQDRSVIRPLGQVRDGESCSVRAFVMTAPVLTRIRKGMELVRFRISDGTATATVSYFNQGWIKNQLLRGGEYVFYGTFEVCGGLRRVANPAFDAVDSPLAGAITPVYRLTAGLGQKVMQKLVREAVNRLVPLQPEILPRPLCEKYHLMERRQAFFEIHSPTDASTLEKARRRLMFEELLTLQLGLGLLKNRVREGTPVRIAPRSPEPFYAALPFEPTGAQRRAVAQAMDDFEKPWAMNRLLQGDVGSGKTMVAAALSYVAAGSGFQTALMAPTEILAEQHCRTLSSMLSPRGMEVALLTGGLPAAKRRQALARMESGQADVVVGTHALLESGVSFHRLGLVVTDEQHRFGVAQRARLAAKGASPHLLVMSATPIPRTLALIFYGDLDVSVLDELPAGRQKIKTYAVSTALRPRVEAFMEKLLKEGRQVYVVCPMVEEDAAGEGELSDVKSYAASLSRRLPAYTVAFLHGRMKSAEKEAVMSRFAAGNIQVLVSTTVIEVGVDVANASLMVVENAERFGLSQLHQLRGRVGRGPWQSYCILISDAKNDTARERLISMTKLDNGFDIAEKDLELRGPGDFFGERQHGLPALSLASLTGDTRLLAEAGEAADDLLRQDAMLQQEQHRLLREHISELFSRSDIALN